MANRTNIGWGGFIGLAGLSLAACAVMIALVTLFFGRVAGTEFNPQTFERRQFSFFEIPLIRLQVTSLSRADISGPVEQHVRSQGYVKPTPGVPETWHLVALRRSTYAATPTDPLILQRYLDARDADDAHYWQNWNVKHPQLAKVLWPEVARLARLNLYVQLPPLFALARDATDPQTFAVALRQASLDQLDEYITRLERASASDPNTQAAITERVSQLKQSRAELQTEPAMQAPADDAPEA
jgi:hypothetical protein